MLISHEVPIWLLPKSLGFNDYNYCLVHLLETHPQYKEFYKNSFVNNKELLLDNSIFELGKAFDPMKFAGYIEELRPTYYVIPDVLENYEETVASYKAFINEYQGLPGAKIGVVQGKTFNDLVQCYKYMSDNADYIAMSFDLSYYQHTGNGNTRLEKQCTGRQRFINTLIQEGIFNLQKPHHLLGCSLAKEFAYYRNQAIPIRSCDTSNPIVAGIEGLCYNGEFGLQSKPKTKLIEYIDHQLDDVQMYRVERNVEMFRKIVTGY